MTTLDRLLAEVRLPYGYRSCVVVPCPGRDDAALATAIHEVARPTPPVGRWRVEVTSSTFHVVRATS